MQQRKMSTTEQIRATVIKQLVDGEINGTTASKKLGLSVRQVKRMKKAYADEGKEGLIHHARGRTGSRKINTEIEKKIVAIIKEKYPDFGPLFATEKLDENHGITYDPETIRQMMIRNKIWKTNQKRKKEYHAWRERRAGFGELQQFDGSYHNWFEGRNSEVPEACLLTSIDDATGRITHAVFEENEGVCAVFRFWIAYILMHGIPLGIYLDKFSTYKINHKAAVDNSELMTQFQRVCREIDVKIIHAHSPQAKGRVERLFQTLQDRLVKELRLHNISTITDANIFLKVVFIPWFNKRYGREPRSTENMHKAKEPIETKLKEIFSIQSQRTVNADFTIQFKNNWYQLKEVQSVTVYKSERVTIEEWIDETIHIKHKDKYLNAFVLPERPKKQNQNPTILTTHKLNWKPKADHPWRNYITNSTI